MRRFLCADASGRIQWRARRIIWIAYLAAGVTACAAAALDPIGLRAIWAYGALSSFVAGLGLLVVPGLLLSRSPGANPPVAAIERDPRWLAVALVIVILFVAGLGRGVSFPA